MVLQKYAAALLSIAIVVLTAFVAIPQNDLTPTALAQLGILGLGSVVTYLVPLLDKAWAGALKTGAAVIAAILAAVIPFLTTGEITMAQIAIVILAGLNALAVEVGVQIRKEPLIVQEVNGRHEITTIQ